ncbi:MarR family winged helix-turn-helix transcriptional regulator, partial [Ideonella sp. A 288]|uniref:MarR family winged helix-turn-helix transcriptional regulator n=1 Tax=Ideonella sp. A 288 TaxID=1962181 RepID=UPI0011849013
MTRPAPRRAASALAEAHIGIEARAGADDHMALRLWLRLLACSTQIETEIRKRLRARFGITLSRFDYLAQLHRHPEGLRMNALSRYLMVTGGNVTGLTDELEKEGLVQREPSPTDRRAFVLTLTPAGRDSFERMAQEHESWVIELLGGLNAQDRKTLHTLLGTLRLTMAQRQDDAGPPPAAAAAPTRSTSPPT